MASPPSERRRRLQQFLRKCIQGKRYVSRLELDQRFGSAVPLWSVLGVSLEDFLEVEGALFPTEIDGRDLKVATKLTDKIKRTLDFDSLTMDSFERALYSIKMVVDFTWRILRGTESGPTELHIDVSPNVALIGPATLGRRHFLHWEIEHEGEKSRFSFFACGEPECLCQSGDILEGGFGPYMTTEWWPANPAVKAVEKLGGQLPQCWGSQPILGKDVNLPEDSNHDDKSR